MKRILLILFLLISFFGAKAQDTLYMKDGKVLEVRVYDILKMKVSFKLYHNLKGPMIKVSTSRVERIVYENGQITAFNDKDFKKKSVFHRQNRIDVGFISIGAPFASLSLSYERLNKLGTFGFEIPATLYYYQTKIEGLTIGLNIKKYLGGDGMGFYYGPSFKYGVVDGGYGNSVGYFGVKLGWQLFVFKAIGFDLGSNVGIFTDFYDVGLGASLQASINFSF